jgi:hypothetical protein
VTLTKLEAGEPWPAVIRGHEVDVLTQQQEQQRLMLERFQREVRTARTRAHAGGCLRARRRSLCNQSTPARGLLECVAHQRTQG